MSSFSSNAILAKARSMYSHRLTEQNYEELLKKRSVNDLTNYLKSETIYGEVLADLNESEVHRGELEALLKKEIFLRLNRLMRYASKKELKFYRLGVTELEIDLILTKIRLIDSPSHTGYEIEIPNYLNKYASFNLYELLSIQDYEELLALLKGTKYYGVLLKFRDDDVNSNILELELKRIYYAEYVETINTLFKGKKRKDLLTIIDTSIELQNITKIYRLKKFFNATPDQIRQSLLLEYSRIPKSTMESLIEAKDAAEFLKLLSNSAYKLYVDDKDFVFIEYHTEKIIYHLAKRFLRFSTDSALVYMTYKIVYQVEIDNLKHIIEGLRYGQTASQIETMLIY